jgi:hypothetical protein
MGWAQGTWKIGDATEWKGRGAPDRQRGEGRPPADRARADSGEERPISGQQTRRG